MKKLDKMLINAKTRFTQFKNSEKGDTNFVSMLLIIGIVVVLAGLFLTLGKDVMDQISDNVTKFIKKLK